MIEKYPLDRIAEAYEQMHSGGVRFCVVQAAEQPGLKLEQLK